jgi:hypothetical protein
MDQSRELLTQAAERLARHSSNMADRVLGDMIYKHLYQTSEPGTSIPFIPLKQAEKED